MATLYRVFVKEPSFEDSAQSPYYTIMIKHATRGKHVANISAITEAAKSISHCDILHIAAGFSQGIVFDHDSVRDFLDMYAPNHKLAITWLDHSDGVVVRPTFESIVAMG